MLSRKLWHRTVTRGFIAAMIEECEDENAGICLMCGNLQDGVEPDAEGYACEQCNAPHVAGLEQLALMTM